MQARLVVERPWKGDQIVWCEWLRAMQEGQENNMAIVCSVQ